MVNKDETLEVKETSRDDSEFKEWQKNKFTQLLLEIYTIEKKEVEERIMSMQPGLGAESAFWQLKGARAAIDSFLEKITNYNTLEFYLDQVEGMKEEAND